MSEQPLEPYQYESLCVPPPGSFRVAEILLVEGDGLVTCLLHTTDWSDSLDYKAVSYAWGDPNVRAPVIC